MPTKKYTVCSLGLLCLLSDRLSANDRILVNDASGTGRQLVYTWSTPVPEGCNCTESRQHNVKSAKKAMVHARPCIHNGILCTLVSGLGRFQWAERWTATTEEGSAWPATWLVRKYRVENWQSACNADDLRLPCSVVCRKTQPRTRNFTGSVSAAGRRL